MQVRYNNYNTGASAFHAQGDPGPEGPAGKPGSPGQQVCVVKCVLESALHVHLITTGTP